MKGGAVGFSVLIIMAACSLAACAKQKQHAAVDETVSVKDSNAQGSQKSGISTAENEMRKLLTGTSMKPASDTKGDINQEEPIIIVEDIYFPALQADEVLDLIVAQDGTKDSFGVSGVLLTVAAKSGDTARELFTVEARGIYDMSGLESRVREITKAIKLLYSVPKDPDSKSMVFIHTIRQQPLGGNLAAIWYVDGNSGFAKKLENIRVGHTNKTSDDCIYICFEELYRVGGRRVDIPTISIYELPTMTKVKQIQYEPYRKKGMYATTMFYNDGAFTVKLSADTTDFTTLEIPIDATSDYRVIASDPPLQN